MRPSPAFSGPLLAAAVFAGPGLAAPAVVADIAPVHSIVARVMEGAGAPQLLLPPGASPHAYSLRPSEAAMLESADLVFWTGEALTPWLAGPLDALATGGEIVALAEAEGVRLLPVREGGPFDAHAHEGEEHAEHGHDEEHAGHGHDEEHAGHGAEAHGDASYDGHFWLDPANAAAVGRAAAEALAAADAANADTYRENAEAFAAELDALAGEIASRIDGLETRGFVVFHDAYQYFEDRFGIAAAGSIALHDADQPSPARMAEIRERIAEQDVACVFAEPEYDPRLIDTATEGTEARSGTLDPMGVSFDPGPGLYPALMRKLAEDLAGCLEG